MEDVDNDFVGPLRLPTVEERGPGNKMRVILVAHVV
jgi:hypothetical protein